MKDEAVRISRSMYEAMRQERVIDDLEDRRCAMIAVRLADRLRFLRSSCGFETATIRLKPSILLGDDPYEYRKMLEQLRDWFESASRVARCYDRTRDAFRRRVRQIDEALDRDAVTRLGNIARLVA